MRVQSARGSTRSPAAGVKFGSFNILADEDVRQGLKEYSNWPTYPQLYVDGEFVGGCDIVLEMAEAGELADACAAGDGKVKNAINERIKGMLAAQDVILFMKGTARLLDVDSRPRL